MRTTLVALSLLAASIAPTQAQARGHLDVGVSVRLPSVSIGLALPNGPAMAQVPGHAVFYAPGFAGNYFYADGLYWVLRADRWYSSAWYDGPWDLVDPLYVPASVLRVPVRYYGRPPAWFAGWHLDRSPRWGDHWGRGWHERRHGWERHDHRVGRLEVPVHHRYEDRGRHDHRGGYDDRGRGGDRGRGRGHDDDHREGHGRGGHGRGGGRH